MIREASASGGRRGAPDLERSGLLVVDKPAGPTSHDVVALVRRALDAPGAGHLGTLDPSATGLLLVAVGAATRCLTIWQGGEKTYEAAFRFGLETSSHDIEGDVVSRDDTPVDESAIRAATAAFVGEILQVPPMVSAVKVGGRRLHELARAGVTITRAPRPVHVAEWTWLGFAAGEGRARIRCSGGTYVRALARDLGRAIGVGATLASLRRLRSEPFGLERSVTVDALRTERPADVWARGGIPLRDALAPHPGLVVTAEELRRIAHGNPILRAASEFAEGGAGWTVLRDDTGRPLALAECSPDPHDPSRRRAQPRIVFPWVETRETR